MIFFSDWHTLLRTLVVGVCAYVGLVFLLRVSGKRTLSKFNAFDFVVTVALGSTLATILLSKDVALAEGLLALALLIFLQFAVAWLSVRSSAFDSLVKSNPRLVFYRGEFFHDVMRADRIAKGEILAAIREQGIASIDDVEAIVLETAGTVSVLKRHDGGKPTALRQVDGAADLASVDS